MKLIEERRLFAYSGKGRNVTIICILFLGWMIAGCAVTVNTIYDESVSYEKYQRFCWFDNCQFTIDGPVYIQKDSATVALYQQAIVEELQRRGYIYDQNNPDFLLHMHIVLDEQEGSLASAYYHGDPDQWEGAIFFGSWDDQKYLYLKGSLIIDIADAEEGTMVWRSEAVEYLDITGDISDTHMRRGIKKVLKKFPPPNP